MPSVIDPYRILQLRRDATEDEIKRAKKILELSLHPDKNRDEPAHILEQHRERLQNVRLAFSLIGTEEARTSTALTSPWFEHPRFSPITPPKQTRLAQADVRD